MPYRPGTILVIDFGEFAGNSIAQIPLMHYKGYRHIAGDLYKPEKTKNKYKVEIIEEDLEYIMAVARAFGKFPVKVKCEGAHGPCEKKERARYLAIPFYRTDNRPERIEAGGPESVNQMEVEHSYFCCEYCLDIRKNDKNSGREPAESGIKELDISFRHPDFLIRSPERRNWIISREELHEKHRKIAYQLTSKGIGDLIDPAEAMAGKVKMTKHAAQNITNKLLHVSEKEMEKIQKEGYKTEFLKYLRTDREPAREEELEDAYRLMKKRELHKHKDIPGEMFLFAH